MICTSLQHKTREEILEILQDPFVEMAEIRLDLCPLSLEDIEIVFSETDKPLIATCRVEGDAEEAWQEAMQKMETAVAAGARYADLEVGAPSRFSRRCREFCHEYGAELIRSWHNFSGTPDFSTLEMYYERCVRYGAAVVKIVCLCKNAADAARILSLYDKPGVQRGKLLAFGMGEAGRNSRLDCLRRGAPFTYAAYAENEATAPGQWGVNEMHKAIYGDRPSFFRNSLQMPASKSFAQRAILAATLADGTSHLRGYSPCEDSEAAIELAKALGAKVRRGSTLTIKGIAADGRTKLSVDKLYTGNSGLLARLAIPVAAQLAKDGTVRIDGGEQLRARPMDGAAGIMASFGTMIKSDETGAQPRLPLTVKGPLISGTAQISGKGGSQLISGLMMALPLGDKNSRLVIDEPRSIPYMFITADVLKAFGVTIGSEMEGDSEMIEEGDWSACNTIRFHIKGGQRYKATDMDLEADWSAAANFLAAGAVFGSAEIQGLDSASLQADLAICDILVDAGASLSSSENGDDICVSKGPLEGFSADLNNCPDLFPIVSVLAAFCEGETRLRGVRRLRGKECDRASAIEETLSRMGVPVSVEGDEMTIRGENLCSRILNGRLLKGGAYSSFHDHRMVMALMVAALGADAPVEIDDTDCVAKSFPEFLEEFR